MTVKFRYKGRTFSSAQSLSSALKHDMNQAVKRSIRSAASGTGARVRKTSQGYAIEGSEEQISRFNRRIR